MNRRMLRDLLILMACLVLPQLAHAQMPGDPAPVLRAQRAAMQRLAMMDGQWRGIATTTLPGGVVHSHPHTERVGLALDSTLRVIEGRSYDSNGGSPFQAFAVVSYDTATKRWLLRSHAQGRAGEFELTPTDSGYVWKIPAGPMTIRYTATIRDGHWREVGVREMPGQAPMPFFEMALVRIGDSTWPDAGAVPPK